MIREMTLCAVLSASLVGSAVLAKAPPPMAKDQRITESLVAARVADVIRKTCPTISARTLVVLTKMAELKSYARRQGNSNAEIEAFIDDPVQKARIKKLASVYLSRAGARAGNIESFCRVGRDEIARGTLAGSLIRSDV